MKRFFRKDPPPGWTPPNPAAAAPVRLLVVPKTQPKSVRPGAAATFAEHQARLHAASVAARLEREAAARTTASRTWTASGPSETIPWTSAAHADDGITLRDARGNVQHLPPDPRLVDRQKR